VRIWASRRAPLSSRQVFDRAQVAALASGLRVDPDVDDALPTRRAAQLNAVLIDTSPQPQASAAQLTEAMGPRYLALPHADARALSAAVQAAQF